MPEFLFFFNSILIGVGLAMDAFSVSLANGLADPCMRKRRMVLMAGVFALFQALMPLIGWVCVHTVATYFTEFEKLIPWIALALLSFIGGKMLSEGITECKEGKGYASCDLAPEKKVGAVALLVQGIATSIDALSVGFTISDYNFLEALLCALIIAAVTFVICFGGIMIGKRFGTVLSGKSAIFGGAILIFIGLEIFITSFF